MEKRALAQARAELAAASATLKRMADSKDFEEFCRVWTDFLVSSNRVYTKLEAGARMNAKSRQWFGGKKRERKADPLLQYLHQARNSDEHGIDGVTELQPGSMALKFRPDVSGVVHIKHLVIAGNRIEADPETAEKLLVEFAPATAKLARVLDDRFKQWFDPPTHHLGKLIGEISPHAVAGIAVTYLEGLVNEAERLPWLARATAL